MVQLDIHFSGVDQSEALRNLIEGHVARLEHYFSEIKSCWVVISAPHRHHRSRYFHTHVRSAQGADKNINRRP
jgi:ribosome-associated translation inhibitor RaiA